MKQLNWTDTSFLRMESPTMPMHISSLYIYDPSTAPGGAVGFKDVLATVAGRLHRAPAFRRKLTELPLGLATPFWVDDPDFDLEFHIRHIALPRPGDWRQLCIQVARLQSRQIDLSKPPWEMTVIEGLDAVEGLPAGCFAVVTKVHHSVIDGVAGVELITAIHDLEPTAPSPIEPWEPETPPTTKRLLTNAAKGGVTQPIRAVKVLATHAPAALVGAGAALASKLPWASSDGVTAPPSRFNGKVTAHRVFEARYHDFEDIRRIKAMVPGATVNDVALAYVGGAVRYYLDHHGDLPETSLVAACPVNIRTAEQAGTEGNMLSAMRIALATDVADPLERLRLIQASTAISREGREGVKAPALLEVAELLPGALLGLGMRAMSLLPHAGPLVVNLTVTNVPNSRVPLYFAGSKLVRTAGNGPLLHGMGLIHLIGTYLGQFSVSLTSDREMMPDPGFYAECMQRSFEDLLKASAV